MNLYRIARPIYADDISGLGASKTPGRWNKAGESTLYTAENPAQCLIEVLAHTTSACLPALKLVKLYLPGIEISDLKLVALSDLPDGWDSPIPLPTTQALGSRLMMVERCIGIVVPSVLVPDGRNVVLNPEHPALLQMKMEWSKDFWDRPTSEGLIFYQRMGKALPMPSRSKHASAAFRPRYL